MHTLVIFLLWLFLMAPAASAIENHIPKPLKAWIPWVLEGEESINCPFDYQDFKSHHCAWPGKLTLDVTKEGGQLNQHWMVFEKSWITLPGDDRHWPQSVKVNGKALPVVKHKNRPSLFLQKGTYTIEGRFIWKSLPESLLLPNTVGLVRLMLNNRLVEFPRIEQNGKLWLNEQTSGKLSKEEDRLQVEVFRQVIDNMPLQLVTRLELNVVGKAREITLGPVLPEKFIPLSLGGQLPMQLESDGMLKLQVRPGNWTVQVVARYPGEATTLALPKSSLPDTELWAFKAQPSLRLTEIVGVDSVDPRQTRIPQEWQNLPVYRMDKTKSFQITVKRRGDPESSPNELQLNRTLWLDFSGKGFTFQDEVSGQLHRGWRLNMSSELPLGRVEINGLSQLVTKTVDKGEQGVEVRHGQINMVADGRIEERTGSVPAVGWMEDFQQVNTQLNLPPGWRLFSVTGADSTSQATWIEKWSLLDIFLVLIGALAIHRLLGVKWAIVAVTCFVLTWHEAGAPHFIWLLVIAALGLLKVAPPGRLRNASVVFRHASILLLIVTVLPYMVHTVRTAIYPQLDQATHITNYQQPMSVTANKPAAREYVDAAGLADELREETMGAISSAPMLPKAPRELKRQKSKLFSSYSEYTDTYDPNSKVQTGPGLPEWQWSSIPISWSGPVQQGQLLNLVLLPPWLTAILQVISVCFVLVLTLCLAGVRFERRKLSVDVVKFGLSGLFVSTLLSSLLIFTPSSAQAEIPTPELLKELKERLLKPPECLPDCAQISQMKLRITPDLMSIRLEVHAAEGVVIPLPSQLDVWTPSQVVIDGQILSGNKLSASGLMSSGGKTVAVLRGKNNALWLSVPKGLHQIDLSGSMPPVRMLQLPLPLKPHRIEMNVNGWEVKGVHVDGKIEQALQIERIEEASKAAKTFQQSILPPFVSVKRILRLGLDWRVDNEITRVSPTGSAIAMEVPLLKGESVISEGVRVKNGKAIIHFSPHDRVVSWQSILTKADVLTLEAADNPDWMEQWNLDVSPVWHAESQGLPEIHHQSGKGTRFPEWRPWPGEKLTINITKPAGIEGRTLTIDRSELIINPGKRATDTSLSFRIRSSQASQHTVTLPDGVTLKDVSINEQTQPIRQENAQVEIPITPGTQNIVIRWQDSVGMGSMIRTPKVNIGADSVNASIQVSIPEDRWVLLAGGPRLGPAILFWGVLLVTILIAIGLGRTTITPLKTHHWILLGVGLTQAHLIAALFIIGWFFAMAFREEYADKIKPNSFNLVQVLLALLTVSAMLGLIVALGFGLLGSPDMQITGNGSHSYLLKWFDDRASELLPSAWVISVSMWFYRALMLLWSLWLAFALLGWLKWAWQCYTTDGLWRNKELIRKADGPDDAVTKESKKAKKDQWTE